MQMSITSIRLPSSWFSFSVYKRFFSSSAIARKIREVHDLPRDDYLRPEKIQKPIYMSECKGTPRREYQVNMINGIRIAPTFNPYQRITKEKRNQLDTWKSRDWGNWNPYSCYAKDGSRLYRLPLDHYRTIDELGDRDEPILSKENVADIKKQYIMHGLTWPWDNDFYQGKVHPLEQEPTLAPATYDRTDSHAKTREALRNMDQLKFEYIQERRQKKRYAWWEKVVKAIGGDQALEQYARVRKIPRLV